MPLKQSGATPAGTMTGVVNLALFRWHNPQAAAFWESVSVWVWVDGEPVKIRHGAGEWGAVALHAKQLTAAPLPLKSDPWQVRQVLNPLPCPVALAAAPCCRGAAQPAGWPEAPWQRVLLKQPGFVTAGIGTGVVRRALFKWHPAQAGALSWFVAVWVKAVLFQGASGWGARTWQEKQPTGDEFPW